MNDDTARHVGDKLRYYLLTPEGQHAVEQWLPYVVGVAVIIAVLALFVGRSSPRLRGKHVRGTRLVSTVGARLTRLLWPFGSSALVIGKVRWPRKLESLHLLVTGATGAGKSQTLHGTLDTLRARGERAIVTDIGGEALRGFGRDGDRLLNPLDARSVSWSPFAEMESAVDADRLAKSMIPDRDGGEREWFVYSQTLVSAVLRRLWENGNASNGALLHALTLASAAELKLLVQGLPAQALFHDGAEKMLASVRGIVGSYLAPYSRLPADAGPTSWSIRRHVREGTGWLWLPYREEHAAALRPLLAAWLGEVVSASLSLPSNLHRRHWLLLDEVASLGRVQGLSDALTKGRKYGLCAIVGLQSVSQLREAYGDDGAQTLLSCLSSQLFLRANDPETADYASRHLGDCEVVRESTSRGRQGETTTTKQHHVERLVLPSELQGLKDRKGYLRFAGQDLVRRVKVPLVKRETVVEAFVPRKPASATPTPAASLPSSTRPALDADAILKAGQRSSG